MWSIAGKTFPPLALDLSLRKWVNCVKRKVCEARGISGHAFFYWQRKFKQAICTELSKLEEEPEKGTLVGWLQIGLGQREQTLDIEIGGCHISVNNEKDPELLKRVCRILRDL